MHVCSWPMCQSARVWDEMDSHDCTKTSSQPNRDRRRRLVTTQSSRLQIRKRGPTKFTVAQCVAGKRLLRPLRQLFIVGRLAAAHPSWPSLSFRVSQSICTRSSHLHARISVIVHRDERWLSLFL